MKCHKMWQFIRVYTVGQDKNNIQRLKYNILGNYIICDPLIYKMDHPDLTVSNFMEKSIGLKGAKIIKLINILDVGTSSSTSTLLSGLMIIKCLSENKQKLTVLICVCLQYFQRVFSHITKV